MKVLLTGATGFIGSHLCHRLVLEGHEVLALVRNPQKAEGLPRQGVEHLAGDLSLFRDPQLTLPPCDVVIHLAAVLAAQSQRQYHDVNHDAVVDLLACLKRQTWQPKRFIFASTLAAAGPSTPDYLKTEQDKAEPIDAYGEAKLKAERYLLEHAPFPVTLFRPGAVYGPGDPAFLTVFKMAARGFGIKVAGHNQRFSYIYIDDLVDAIIQLARDADTNHKTYFTVYPEPTSIGEMWALMSEEMERKVFLAPIPKSLLYCLMLGSTALAKIFPFKNQLDFKQYRQLIAPAFICSSEALRRDFNWMPKHDIQSCIENTAAGYRAAGWL